MDRNVNVDAVSGILSAKLKLFLSVTRVQTSTFRYCEFVWQACTLAWITLGIQLIAAPGMGARATQWIGSAALLNFAAGSIGGLVAIGWEHYGWLLLQCHARY